MLSFVLLLATPAYTVPPGLAVVGGLHGCWRVSGQVQGEASPSIARGEWHLGRRYFTLHLRATGAKPYEAAITYGAVQQPRAIGSVFSDTFGGLYEPSLGLGTLEESGFVQRYRFPDAIYLNRFSREGTGWRWTITEERVGKPASIFADYRLRPASCRGMAFDY
ncbi:hypothetical protein SAMN06297144_0513 [Sphingomonas guangdongensis]|uniref:Uncharacterized protein n=2 Tax=Sphingomonas guangdongensis TaxID=1141890 RepID=A0A285QC38_9SPHN|nr:hypothetical protein SAMN06297144_0513 [Sphingomonas guangdongensis]